ncbi:response regulator transcription factor [Jeotgalibacillus terrae]|uniref:Response regulator n=1 Tax=Jeotgalibacillus terrae TaxID=587735 RepID=A0ABW5ZL12_9BACL|nr:response regulator [Jeotgalibacillus terrae]MBM7579644.1 two-component system response regulator YesN [Jeotgalibacillus terrae]
MFCKLLVVDDEQMITRGLAETIEWEEHRVIVTHTAQNGIEALDIIAHNDIDIVITDINMPEMNGIKLAEEIMKNHSHIKVIVLSGYDEFEYAQGAMRFNVKDYLLKPVNIDELLKRVNKLTEEIISERTGMYKSQLRTQLSDLIYKKRKSSSLPSGFLIGTEMRDCDFEKTIHEELIGQVKGQWVAEVETICSLAGQAVSVFSADNQLITYIRSDRKVLSHEELSGLNRNLTKLLGAEFVTAYISYISEGEELKSDFDLLINTLGRSAFLDRTVLDCEQHQPVEIEELPHSLIMNIVSLMKSEQSAFNEVAGELTAYASTTGWTVSKLIQHVSQITKDQLGIEPAHEIKREFVINTKSYLKETITFYFEGIHHQLIQDFQDGGTSWLMVQASNYIKEHFKYDLKASEVANVINISAGYFSQLIKQETGMHFNDYLHHIRLEHAKKLLKETSYKVFEIGEMVGYKDYKYFVHIFKKNIGESPTQYRKSVVRL